MRFNKYFLDLHKLKEKWKVTDKNQVQQIIRRALVRDTLNENERLRLKGAERIEKKKEAKVEELKKTMGISTFAISRKEVQEAKTQISLKSPQRTEPPAVSLKISEKKIRATLQFKPNIGVDSPLSHEQISTGRTSTRITETENDQKAWKANMRGKKRNSKDGNIKKDFFKATDENKGQFFKTTLR